MSATSALATDNLVAPGATNAPITVSEDACKHFVSLLESENASEKAVRVFISGRGCSGFSYGLELADGAGEDEIEFVAHGVRFVLDEIAARHMVGASVDWVSTPRGEGFSITNPNDESASCGSGCGGCGCGANEGEAAG